MKRLITWLTLICMLVGVGLLMVSCDAVTEKDIQKDPTVVLSEALENTLREFFADGPGVVDVLVKSLEDGKISAKIEGEDLLEEELDSITETLYFNAKDGRIISDTEVKVDGKTLAAQIYLNKQSIIAKSESLLGDSTAYGISYDAFVQNFEDSDLAQMMGVDENSAAQIVELVEKLTEKSDKGTEELERILKAILAEMPMEVREESVMNAEGKSVDGFVVTYTLDNDALEAMLDIVCDELVKPYLDSDTADELEDGINEIFKEIDSAFRMELTLDIYLVAKTNTISAVELDGSLKPRQADEYGRLDIEGALTFDADEIALAVEIKADGEKSTLEAAIRRRENDRRLSYELDIEVGSGSYSMSLLNVSVEYTKENGDFEISVSMEEEGPSEVFSLEGNVTVKSGKQMTMTIERIKFEGESIKPGITVTAEVGAKAPKAPKSFDDLLELSENDLDELVARIEESIEEIMEEE